MYINWAHHYVPKFSGTCSVLINSLFIYIVHDDKKINLGSYRFLLIFFALYNFTSTGIDLLVPCCVLDYKYSFSFFIVDGVFEKRSFLGTLFVNFRCCIISAAYCILHCHFVYRYMLLFCRKILDYYFVPYGLLVSVGYCLLIMILWFPATAIFAVADEERRNYMAPIFKERFDVDINDVNIIICLYDEATPQVIRNSWVGVMIGTSISVYSVIVCFIFGTLIIVKLQKGDLSMSEKTKHLQKQLMKALIVQSSIPMIVCFCPCFSACRKILDFYFIPYGLLCSICYCFIIMGLWFPAPFYFADADEERRKYLEEEFEKRFNANINDVNIIICLFNEASSKVTRNSWLGISIGTSINVYSIIVCLVLGSTIIVKLQKGDLSMSDKTKHLQKQLMRALIVQSSIPMVVCFCPYFFAWYLPVFKLDIGNWINWTAPTALSFFSVLDPLALFYFIPVFRLRVQEIFKIKTISIGSITSRIAITQS